MADDRVEELRKNAIRVERDWANTPGTGPCNVCNMSGEDSKVLVIEYEGFFGNPQTGTIFRLCDSCARILLAKLMHVTQVPGSKGVR